MYDRLFVQWAEREGYRVDVITPRIATGAATKQVAYVLGITPKTAATHVERIYAKTGVSSRAAVTRFAIQHSLVNPIDSPA